LEYIQAIVFQCYLLACLSFRDALGFSSIKPFLSLAIAH
jgi:hypothetical protein